LTRSQTLGGQCFLIRRVIPSASPRWHRRSYFPPEYRERRLQDPRQLLARLKGRWREVEHLLREPGEWAGEVDSLRALGVVGSYAYRRPRTAQASTSSCSPTPQLRHLKHVPLNIDHQQGSCPFSSIADTTEAAPAETVGRPTNYCPPSEPTRWDCVAAGRLTPVSQEEPQPVGSVSLIWPHCDALMWLHLRHVGGML